MSSQNYLKVIFSRPLLTKGAEIRDVKRIKAEDLTSETFFRDYVQQSRPVLITHATTGWPALRKWNNEYLRNLVGNHTAKVEISVDNVFRYTSEGHFQMPFSEFIDRLEKQTKDGDQHYAIGIEGVETLKKDLKLGTGGQITPVHFDECENLMTVVDGAKTFTLFPPAMTPNMYPLHAKNLFSSSVDVDAPDTERYPLFKATRPVKVTIHKGEMLYTPAFWWHHVTSSPQRNLAINFFFHPHSTLLLQFYAGLKERMPQEANEYC